jgi:hypothetical protein
MNNCHGRRRFTRDFYFSMILYLAVWVSANPAHANDLGVKQSAICQRTKLEWKNEFEVLENRMAFRNEGGLMDGGVCWWHSRLQRSAVYLARFKPTLPQPTIKQARTLVQSLVHFKKVVTIPGYSNFNDFSKDHEPLIQEELNRWQLRDGVLYQQWIRGLYGRPQMSAANLKKRMQWIYRRFQNARPGLWVMAQMPGITSHSLLLLDMKPHPRGFTLKVIDSNRPMQTRTVDYLYGQNSLFLGTDPFTPFVGFETDQLRIQSAIKQYCRKLKNYSF